MSYTLLLHQLCRPHNVICVIATPVQQGCRHNKMLYMSLLYPCNSNAQNSNLYKLRDFKHCFFRFLLLLLTSLLQGAQQFSFKIPFYLLSLPCVPSFLVVKYCIRSFWVSTVSFLSICIHSYFLCRSLSVGWQQVQKRWTATATVHCWLHLSGPRKMRMWMLMVKTRMLTAKPMIPENNPPHWTQSLHVLTFCWRVNLSGMAYFVLSLLMYGSM